MSGKSVRRAESPLASSEILLFDKIVGRLAGPSARSLPKLSTVTAQIVR